MSFDDMTYVDEPLPTSTGATPTTFGDDGYIDDQYMYTSSTGAAGMQDDGFAYTSSTIM